MRGRISGRYGIVICSLFCFLFADQVFAQSDKVSISYVPIPNQTIRFTITSEGEININYSASGTIAEVQPMKMTIKSVFGMSQKTGQFDAQERIEADLTYEIGESQFLLNGSSFPIDESGKRL